MMDQPEMKIDFIQALHRLHIYAWPSWCCLLAAYASSGGVRDRYSRTTMIYVVPLCELPLDMAMNGSASLEWLQSEVCV